MHTMRSLLRACSISIAILAAGFDAHHLRAQTTHDLDSTVSRLMREGDVPGLSAAVVRNGVVHWTGTFGVRHSTTRNRVESATVFDAASLTKPVVAYAVLQLADRGLVDLDRPIADILPNDRMKHDVRYARITPRMVMSHGTGLPNWGGNRLDLAFEPGKGWGYSGEGFVWLGDAAAKVAGMTLNDLIRREVFEPLGMTHSSLVWNDTLELNGTSGHDEWGRPQEKRRPGEGERGGLNAAASLRTTAADYARFLIALMEGRRLTDSMAMQVFRVQNEARTSRNHSSRPADLRERIAWGMGVGLTRSDGGITAWHWGDNGFSKAYMLVDPRSRTAIVFFANSQNGLSIARAMTSLVFPGEDFALQWLSVESYDAPNRVARRALVRAGLDSGAAATARTYAAQRLRLKDSLSVEHIVLAAEMLGQESVPAAGDTLLALAARDYPMSPRIPLVHGDMTLGIDVARARGYYVRAAALAPNDTAPRMRVEWADDLLQAARRPVVVAPATLASFVGDYGPRRIMLDEGRLFYQRGTNRRFPLTPIGNDTFVLEGNATFRIRFSSDATGRPATLTGLYLGGDRDENRRDAQR